MSPIDFVVFGVPRSGTSVLVEALNTQAGLFCAHEFGLATRSWASREEVVGDVLARSPSGTGTFRGRGREALERKLAAGGVTALGDKMPEYFLSLGEVTRRHPGIRKLCIYRSPIEFTKSWDRLGKAGTPNGWPAGRVGIFGVFDLLILLHVLAEEGEDTAVVSHRALFHASAPAFREVVRFVAGTDSVAVEEAAFRSLHFARRKPMDLTARGGPYGNLVWQSGLAEIDAFMERSGFLRAPQPAGFLATALPGITDRLPALFEAVFRRHFEGQAEVAAFARLWAESRGNVVASNAMLDARLGAAFARLRQALPR